MIGEPHSAQKIRCTPFTLKLFMHSSPFITTKSFMATKALDAKAVPVALRHREQ
jgi:hypothetical protein